MNSTVSFRYERELVSILVSCVPELRLGDRCFCFWKTEFPAGSRVVDVAVAGFREDPLLNEAYLRKLRSLPSILSDILGVISYYRSTDAQALSRHTGLDEDSLNGYLAHLDKAGLVERVNGTVQLGRWQDFLPDVVITIEAKLVRWKQVVKQAERNCFWANESYVALPPDTASRDEVRALCIDRGLGILSVNADQVKVTYKPCGRRPETTIASMMRIKILRDILAGRAWLRSELPDMGGLHGHLCSSVRCDRA